MSTYHRLLEGAAELHCHSSPSIFPRKQTDWQLLSDAATAGMAAVLLKSHESLTADRASLLQIQNPGVEVYGGLVCNYCCGGLSPYAVDVAIRLGAKCIWMPTISAEAHCRHFAQKKTRLFGGNASINQPEKGLTIWDNKRRVLPEVHEILQLIADADIILATGHLSPEEVLAITDAAVAHGIDKILIQHADMSIARIPLDMQVTLAQKGAMIEKCYLACGDDFNDLTVSDMVSTIKKVGYDSCVMVTDHGQAHNLPTVKALSNFVEEVMRCDVPENAVRQMIAANPKRLLD